MTLIDRWFEQTEVSQDYTRPDYVVLWLILAAGAFLRFWGLGNVGLHGDEETMAMPAMAILETGQPILPSGVGALIPKTVGWPQRAFQPHATACRRTANPLTPGPPLSALSGAGGNGRQRPVCGESFCVFFGLHSKF